MYTITFEDGTKFIGGSPEESNWGNIPDKNISSWEYNFLKKDIKLSKYESYNHLVERVNIVGAEIITKVILMGKKNQTVQSIVFDLQNKKLYRCVNKFGEEYCGKSTLGWKRGLKG